MAPTIRSGRFAPATYTIRETAASGSPPLSDYLSSYACTLNGSTGPSGAGTSVQVTVAAADVLACRFVNTRKTT